MDIVVFTNGNVKIIPENFAFVEGVTAMSHMLHRDDVAEAIIVNRKVYKYMEVYPTINLDYLSKHDLKPIKDNKEVDVTPIVITKLVFIFSKDKHCFNLKSGKKIVLDMGGAALHPNKLNELMKDVYDTFYNVSKFNTLVNLSNYFSYSLPQNITRR